MNTPDSSDVPDLDAAGALGAAQRLYQTIYFQYLLTIGTADYREPGLYQDATALCKYLQSGGGNT